METEGNRVELFTGGRTGKTDNLLNRIKGKERKMILNFRLKKLVHGAFAKMEASQGRKYICYRGVTCHVLNLRNLLDPNGHTCVLENGWE